MTDDENLCPAEILASDLFTRNLSAWGAVQSFRWLGQLGLPHATDRAAEHLQQGFQSASSRIKGALEARVLDNMIKAATKLFTGAWPPRADPEFLIQALTKHSATTFASGNDALIDMTSCLALRLLPAHCVYSQRIAFTPSKKEATVEAYRGSAMLPVGSSQFSLILNQG
jgi:hypothetical protein